MEIAIDVRTPYSSRDVDRTTDTLCENGNGHRMRRWVRCSGMVIHADGATKMMSYNHDDEEMMLEDREHQLSTREIEESHWGKTPIAHVSRTMLDASTIRSNRVIDAINKMFFSFAYLFFIGVSGCLDVMDNRSLTLFGNWEFQEYPVAQCKVLPRKNGLSTQPSHGHEGLGTGQKAASLSSDYIQLWKAKKDSSLPWIFNVKLSLMSFVGFWTFNCEIKINK